MSTIRKGMPKAKATAFASLVMTWLVLSPASDSRVAHADSVGSGRHAELSSRLPVAFERNGGQTDARAEFLARGKGYTLFLTKGAEAVVSLRGAAVSLRLVGARGDSAGQGASLLPGTVNYLVGADRSAWRTGIATYEKVRYSEVYPGIDVVYYSNRGELEYDFLVKPGADPTAIMMEFDGADRVTIDDEGALVATIGQHQMVQRAPVIYQERNGVRREVRGRYVLASRTRAAFLLEKYDRAETLIIDPVLVHATSVNETTTESPSADRGHAIAICGDGTVYVTGLTDAVDFPTTEGSLDTEWNGDLDAFIVKLNASGTALEYATYLGGTSRDIGRGIAVDAAGYAYVAGYTSSADFPVTSGAFDSSWNGGDDVFVAKVDPSGAALGYSTYVGGSSLDLGKGIALDPKGNAYVTGETLSEDFPTTASLDASWNGSRDGFAAKLDADGATLVYSTYLGGSGFDVANGIAVDAFGAAHVTGSTFSTDFPVTDGDFMHAKGLGDAFLTKLEPDGAVLAYSIYLGGTLEDDGLAVTVDLLGHAYVAGSTRSADFPVTFGAFDRIVNNGFSGVQDGFVTKVAPGGMGLLYSSYLGGGRNDRAMAIAVDLAGNAYVSGNTDSTDFPASMFAFDRTWNSTAVLWDAFVTKVHTSGAMLSYSTYLGGNFEEIGNGIAVDLTGNAYVVGYTSSSNFPTTPGAFDRTLNGSESFVTKLNRRGSALGYSTFLGGTFTVVADAGGSGVAIDQSARHGSPLAVTEYPRVSADRFVLDADRVVPVFLPDQMKELSRIMRLRLFQNFRREAGPAR